MKDALLQKKRRKIKKQKVVSGIVQFSLQFQYFFSIKELFFPTCIWTVVCLEPEVHVHVIYSQAGFRDHLSIKVAFFVSFENVVSN